MLRDADQDDVRAAVAAALLAVAVGLVLWTLYRGRPAAPTTGSAEPPTAPVGPSWS